MIRALLVTRDPDWPSWLSDDQELQVRQVPTGQDAFSVLTDGQFQVVVAEDLPGDSPALDLLEKIRSLEMPVSFILFTRTRNAKTGAKALNAGADYYLGKMTRDTGKTLLPALIRNLVFHRQVSERLRQDNAIMRAIHDASPLAACVIRDHVIVWLNAIMPRMLGYEEFELIGADPIQFIPGDEEHRRIDAGLFDGPTEDGWGMVEGQLKRKDGSMITCHLLSRPLDPDDLSKGRIVIGQDITEYVRMRDLLRKSEVRYQNLMDSANSIVLRVDTRGTIRFINRFGASFFGYAPEELTGKNLIDTILPRKSRTGRDLARMVRDVMQNPEEFEINVNENMKRDGERVWIAWTNRAIRDDQGRMVEMLSIGNDITERSSGLQESSLSAAPWISGVLEGTDISDEVFEEVYSISVELAREGREGKPIGTTFLIGDAREVLGKSTQLILNPFEGHPPAARNVTNPEVRETVKELSPIDGAFVISGDGVVEAAGRYITIDTSRAAVPKGLGTRHASVAGITQETSAVGVVLSQSGGKISLFKDGRIFRVISVRE
jgi:diadenylate cyclase